MASYDWFLRELHKIGNKHADLIGKDIFVVDDNDLTVHKGIIMNVVDGMCVYKELIDRNTPIYPSINMKLRGIRWSLSEGRANELLDLLTDPVT